MSSRIHSYGKEPIDHVRPREAALESSSSLNRVLPLKSSTFWKGAGLGLGICLLVAIGVPSLMRSRMAANRLDKFSDFEVQSRYTGNEALGSRSDVAVSPAKEIVLADAPKIISKAELNLLVANCADTRKKIEDIAAAESGFLESSTLQDNWAKMTLRVPSVRFDAVRTKLRALAIRVREDSVSAADVSKQYVDREARLRNLRAEEQQFLAIMKNAHSVPDVLAVSKELSEVRGQIDRADTELRNLKDEIDMAEIEINLISQTSATMQWAPGSSIRSAWDSLLRSLADLADFLIWLVVNLPLLVLWGLTIFLLAAAGWYVLRKAFRAMRAMFGKKTPLPQTPAG
jgi:hypothetical protein